METSKESIADVPTSELSTLIKKSIREIRQRNELVISELQEIIKTAREEIRQRNNLVNLTSNGFLTEKRYNFIMCLLENPLLLNLTLGQIGKRAGVSISLVKYTLGMLEEMGYLKGKELINFDKLEKLCSEYEKYRI